ncbi:RNA recognition motif domain-containing protein [Ditylenchus destructor]|nr:RNA recognition motif domain-containing protein [Ditylenchus destructor]
MGLLLLAWFANDLEQMIDDDYTAVPTNRGFSITGLNDNVDEKFLRNLCRGDSGPTEVVVYHHPITNRHLGIALMDFNTQAESAAFIEKYNGKTIMGSIVQCFFDPLAYEISKLFKEKTGGNFPSLPARYVHLSSVRTIWRIRQMLQKFYGERDEAELPKTSNKVDDNDVIVLEDDEKAEKSPSIGEWQSCIFTSSQEDSLLPIGKPRKSTRLTAMEKERQGFNKVEPEAISVSGSDSDTPAVKPSNKQNKSSKKKSSSRASTRILNGIKDQGPSPPPRFGKEKRKKIDHKRSSLVSSDKLESIQLPPSPPPPAQLQGYQTPQRSGASQIAWRSPIVQSPAITSTCSPTAMGVRSHGSSISPPALINPPVGLTPKPSS